MEGKTIPLLALIPSVEQSKFHRLTYPWRWAGVSLYRVWWHTHAYATVFGILFLTLLSLVVLYLHNQSTKLRFKLQWHQSTKLLLMSTRRSE